MHWVTKIELRFYIDTMKKRSFRIAHFVSSVIIRDLHTFSGFSKNERFSTLYDISVKSTWCKINITRH